MFNLSSMTRLAAAGALLTFSAACGGSNTAATDSAAGAAATATTPSGDTGSMAGMSHGDMNRPAAKDGDHEFLRMMADHHEGMIQMATAAMTKGSNPTTQADAHKLHTKQADEQKQMIAMIQSQYQETLKPMVMASNKAMNDALQAKSGADYDRTFYANVIAHHREGISMTDQILPRITKPEIRQMAEKMKADQQKEIAEFERKAR